MSGSGPLIRQLLCSALCSKFLTSPYQPADCTVPSHRLSPKTFSQPSGHPRAVGPPNAFAELRLASTSSSAASSDRYCRS
jgi:hypothetical protein